MHLVLKKILVCVVLLSMLPGVARLSAGTFQDAIDKNKEIHDESSGSSSSDDDSEHPIAEFLFDLMGQLWILDVKTVIYGGYPYCPDGFVTFHPVLNRDGDDLGWTPGRSWWCTVGGSGGLVYRGFYGMQPVGELALESQALKMIGPDMSITALNDDGDPFLLSQVGFRFNLLQFRSFVWSWFIGYCNKSEYDVSRDIWLVDHGVPFGIDLRIFPADPLTLRGRVGFFCFDGYSITDTRIEVGYMLDALELYLQKRTLSTGEPDSPGYARFDAVSLGARYWL